MAPVTIDTIESQLQGIIHTLYEVSVSIYAYQGASTTGAALSSKIVSLSSSLQLLSSTAPHISLPVPPEVLEYVEQGRNPDIYTREFVETVQKSNEYLKGKSRAWRDFRDVLAQEIARGMPDLSPHVQKVCEATGGKVALDYDDGLDGLKGERKEAKS